MRNKKRDRQDAEFDIEKEFEPEKRRRREMAEDVVKHILQWLVVSALGFVYWLVMLLLVSLFLNSVWHVTFEQLLTYSIVLAVITSVGYAVVLLRRKFGN